MAKQIKTTRTEKQNLRCFGDFRLIEEIFEELGDGLRVEEIDAASEGLGEKRVREALAWASERFMVRDEGARGWSRIAEEKTKIMRERARHNLAPEGPRMMFV